MTYAYVRTGFETKMVAVIAWLIIASMLSPIIVVVVISLTGTNSLQFPPPAWGFDWYREAWNLLGVGSEHSSTLRESLITSLKIAITTSVVCAACGVPAAYALSRFRFPGKRVVEAGISLPVVFPTIVLGVALLAAVSQLRTDLGVWQIAVGHIIIALPFMIRNCYAAIAGIDKSFEEAAQTLGASATRAFMEIVLPLMRSGLLSGLLLVFIISMNEFTLAYFLYTTDVSPVSIWLFQQANTSLNPTVFAISTMLIVLNIAVILAVERMLSGKGSFAIF